MRTRREIEHGRMLAGRDSETLWGWGTLAGKQRAIRRAQLIAEGAGLAPGVLAMEIGCGTGSFTSMFIETGATLVALDVSPDLLGIAERRGLPKDRAQFVQGDFETSQGLGPFDAIIGSSVLHHLDLDAALAKARQLLRPGGILSLAEPNLLNPQVFLERTFRRWFPYVSPDETAFVRWRLARRLRETGFEKITIRPFDWLHPATPPAWIHFVQSLGSQVERIPCLREFSGSLYIRAVRQAE